MSRRTYQDRVVVITGASSGIGAALARELAAEGARLVLAARRKAMLETLVQSLPEACPQAVVVACDVTDDDQCRALIEKTVALFGRIDLLVVNAGISTNATVQTLGLEVARRVMDVNYYGSVQPFLHALPHLVASRGQVLVISSLAGKKGLPTRAAYCASKFALHGFFDAARADLQQDGVGVTIACPGLVATEVRHHALLGDGREQGVDDEASRPMQSVEACAREILAAVRAGKRELIMGGLGPKLMALFDPIAPSLIDRAVSRVSSRDPSRRR